MIHFAGRGANQTGVFGICLGRLYAVCRRPPTAIIFRRRPMGSQHVPPVTQVAQRKTTRPLPGQLDLFADNSWEFTGNGSASTTDVAQSIINFEVKADPQYAL